MLYLVGENIDKTRAHYQAETGKNVRLAPLYDAVTTVVFPSLEHDRMAMKTNGKDNRLRRADFLKMAATAGLTVTAANQAIEELLSGLRAGVDAVTTPNVAGMDEDIAGKAQQMLAICRERVGEFK